MATWSSCRSRRKMPAVERLSGGERPALRCLRWLAASAPLGRSSGRRNSADQQQPLWLGAL
eukprot:8067557-Pyramimonas_sp.AAC.1